MSTTLFIEVAKSSLAKMLAEKGNIGQVLWICAREWYNSQGRCVMNSNEVWARCADCGTELKQDDKQCPNPECNSTKKSFDRRASVAVGEVTSCKAIQKRKGMGTLVKMILNRWKRSGDPKFKDGVREDLIVNKEKDKYDQVVKDARTGEITHEEHQHLSEHNKQRRKDRKGIS